MELIDNAERRLEMSDNAYEYVANNRLLSQHFRKRYDWYCDLLSKKTELSRQIASRVPEMKLL